jgi:hypothetical protein
MVGLNLGFCARCISTAHSGAVLYGNAVQECPTTLCRWPLSLHDTYCARATDVIANSAKADPNISLSICFISLSSHISPP